MPLVFLCPINSSLSFPSFHKPAYQHSIVYHLTVAHKVLKEVYNTKSLCICTPTFLNTICMVYQAIWTNILMAHNGME